VSGQPAASSSQTEVVVGRRYLAVINGTRTRAKGFIFAKGIEKDRAEYFVHISGVKDEWLWEALTEGDGISCEVQVTPKGLRAHAVRRATEAEQATIDDACNSEEENRGNR